ncbi:MAG: serine/threonine protein kinase [Verrucomicrobia bacterium]|nr:serine/threonine protein kinase [Verrucomicrobiota bacterium]
MQMQSRPGFLFLSILLLQALPLSAEEHWPQFRGPKSLGTSENNNLPTTWGANQNVKWRTDVPGYGWSSPIAWGDKIFLTSVVKDGEVETPKKGLYFGGDRPTPSSARHQWMVYCLDLKSGKKLWEKQAHQGAPSSSIHLKNTYASETPVTDGERVYAYFGNVGIYCLDFAGNEIWSKRLESFKTRYGWGTAASPILHNGRLYIVNDNEEQSFLVALDAKTGRQIWRVERDEKSNWATPYIWENEKRTEIVTPGRNKVRSYDLAGKLLWEFGGMSTIVIPTPFSKFGLLYVCSGYVGDGTRPVFAIRPGASGEISLKPGETSNEHIAWYQKTAAPYNPSPLVYGDYFYVLYDRGLFSCYEARTGRLVYDRERLNPEGTGAYTASPWACNGRVFCLSEDGDTFVIEAGPKFKLLGKNSLNEMCMATPAMAQESLIVRTTSKLYCIQNRGTAN